MTVPPSTDRGSALPGVVALVVAGLLLTGVAIDIGRWGATWRAVADAAAAGARAGAGQVDQAGLYLGRREVESEEAIGAAFRIAHAGGTASRSVVVDVDSTTVCVTVTETHHPTSLRAVGGGPTPVSVTACASPAQG